MHKHIYNELSLKTHFVLVFLGLNKFRVYKIKKEQRKLNEQQQQQTCNESQCHDSQPQQAS